MAEYYPLISRAVAGLRDGAPEARQAIYGRAKQALVGQLRGMQPPIPEAAIDKEIAALDEAIARIESEIVPVPAPALAVESRPAAAPPPSDPVAPKPQTARPAAPITARPGAASVTPPRPERTAFAPRASLPPARPAVARPVRPSAPTVVPAEAVAPTLPVPPAPPVPELPPAPVLPLTPTLKEADRVVEPAPTAPSLYVSLPRLEDEDPARAAAPTPELSVADGRARDEGLRPAIPRAETPRPRNMRVWIVALAAIAAVVVIALTAWKLRDSPEELARASNPSPQAEATPGKIVERADGTGDDADAPEATATVVGTGQTTAQVSAPSAPAGTAQPAGDQAIPVSYKAAILVAAPDTPEKVKTYVGSVVWRSENVAQGQGQPLGTAVRADVDIPDAGLQLVIEIRKNIEAQFPASHTMDFKFTIGAGSPIGGVKQIDVPQMRREDAPTGDTLVGVPVTITANYFLVGLTRDAEARNVEAMRTRGWFDVPLVLGDGKAAKITFEKGASGDRILADALATWSRP